MDFVHLFYKAAGIRDYGTFLIQAKKCLEKNLKLHNNPSNIIEVSEQHTHDMYYKNKPYKVYTLRFSYADLLYFHRKSIVREVAHRVYDPSNLESEVLSMYSKALVLDFKIKAIGNNVPKIK